MSFSIDAWTATSGQRGYLRDFVLTDPPPLLGFESTLDDPDLHFLAVSDSGTRGLCGPTRADVDPRTYPDGRTDFVDLVRDTGRRASKGFAGGTYGFGKVVLCQASALGTVVIFTRTPMSGADGSRFIAMAIGDDEYVNGSTRYTGRHWWGNVRGDLAEPLLGADAEAAAFNLGIQGLISGLSGTAILVIAPRSPEAETSERLESITEAIADAAGEYAWPHMIDKPGQGASIDLRVTLNGTHIPIKNPASDPRLRVFEEAFLRCEQLLEGSVEPGDAWPWHRRIVASQRPIMQLGTLTWRHQASPDGTDPRSQIALIRNPHFVVTYKDVPKDLSGKETFGVFLAAPDLDADYAESEPPTHDAWIPKKGERFNPARRVLKEIPDLIRERPKVDRSHTSGAEAPGVVAIASALGILLDGQTSTGDTRVPWSPEPRPPFTMTDPAPATSQATHPDASQPRFGNSPLSNAPSPFAGTEASDSTDDVRETPLPSSSANNPWPGERQLRASKAGSRTAGRPRYQRASTVRMDGPPILGMYAGRMVAEFPFTLHVSPGLGRVMVSAKPSVFIEGGKESEPPVGADMPTVLGWHDRSSGILFQGPELTVARDVGTKWAVLVLQPADAAVSVDLSATDER